MNSRGRAGGIERSACGFLHFPVMRPVLRRHIITGKTAAIRQPVSKPEYCIKTQYNFGTAVPGFMQQTSLPKVG
jgi:hypothetical protein